MVLKLDQQTLLSVIALSTDMIIFNYNDDGEFVGFSEAEESPLEPGTYLIPANATTVAVPQIPEGKIAKFLNGVWSLVNVVVDPPEIVEQDVYIYDPNNDNVFVRGESTVNGVIPINGTLVEPPDRDLRNLAYFLPAQQIWELRPRTPEEQLNVMGLTVDELKTLLGI